jgi:plasmid stabilization system protein ParE
MALNVELSDRARRDIEQIADYLAENWSEHAKLNFLVTLTDKIKLISQMPYLYKASQKSQPSASAF